MIGASYSREEEKEGESWESNKFSFVFVFPTNVMSRQLREKRRTDVKKEKWTWQGNVSKLQQHAADYLISHSFVGTMVSLQINEIESIVIVSFSLPSRTSILLPSLSLSITHSGILSYFLEGIETRLTSRRQWSNRSFVIKQFCIQQIHLTHNGNWTLILIQNDESAINIALMSQSDGEEK